MKKGRYDVFVSYRRDAYDTANLIAEKLRNAGYSVFFDIDTLTSGKFNEQLIGVISKCKDFILILPENALDRCNNEGDWIRREVTCALQHNKNIIPVMLDGFVWPEVMPKGMEDLSNYQAITATGHEYFDMAIERLKGYLKSSPSKPIKLWMTKAGIFLAVLAIVIGIGLVTMHHIANVVCESIGTQQSSAMNVTDLMGDVRTDLKKNYLSFYTAIKNSKKDEERQELENEMLTYIKKMEKEVNGYSSTLPEPDFNINGIETYILGFYKIKKEELDAFTSYYKSIFEDMDDIFNLMKEQIEGHDYSQRTNDRVLMNLNCIGYSINAFYYAYLGSISLLPKSARTTHYEMAKKWKSFPNGTPLDLSQEDYEQFQMKEINRYEEEVQSFGADVNFEEYRLNELEEQVDGLQKLIESE